MPPASERAAAAAWARSRHGRARARPRRRLPGLRRIRKLLGCEVRPLFSEARAGRHFAVNNPDKVLMRVHNSWQFNLPLIYKHDTEALQKKKSPACNNTATRSLLATGTIIDQAKTGLGGAAPWMRGGGGGGDRPRSLRLPAGLGSSGGVPLLAWPDLRPYYKKVWGEGVKLGPGS